ncbi:MAG: GtrA family protein [Sulfobacillus thermotolerans]|nr:GtrA family protein [Sulfobacillus thermotolerans]
MGTSKGRQSVKQLFIAPGLCLAALLRVSLIRQAIKYALSGGIAALGAWTTSFVLYNLGHWSYLACQSMGFLVGLAVNYPLSHRWTFRSPSAMLSRQLPLFIGVALMGLALNEGAVWVAVASAHIAVPIAMAMGLFTAFLWNFTANRWITFAQ